MLQAMKAHATNERFGYRSCAIRAVLLRCNFYDPWCFYQEIRTHGRAKPLLWQT